MNDPVCERVRNTDGSYHASLQQCCDMFFYPMEHFKNHAAEWKLTGFKRTMLVPQMHAVFWLLKMCCSPRHGAVLADQMGLGKSTMAIGVWWILVKINRVHAEIWDARRHNFHGNSFGHHLPADHKDDDVCPSQALLGEWLKKYPFQCPCHRSSVTAQFTHFVLGPTQIVPPATLNTNWVNEIVNIFDFDAMDGVRVRVAAAVKGRWDDGTEVLCKLSERDRIGLANHPNGSNTLQSCNYLIIGNEESIAGHLKPKLCGRIWQNPEHVLLQRKHLGRKIHIETLKPI